MVASVGVAVFYYARVSRQRKHAQDLQDLEEEDCDISNLHASWYPANDTRSSTNGAPAITGTTATGAKSYTYTNPLCPLPPAPNREEKRRNAARLGDAALLAGVADEWQQIAAAGEGIDWSQVRAASRQARQHRTQASQPAQHQTLPPFQHKPSMEPSMEPARTPVRRPSTKAHRARTPAACFTMMAPSPLRRQARMPSRVQPPMSAACKSSSGRAPPSLRHNRFSVLEIV